MNDDRRVLLDPDSGLHAAWYFWLRALDECHRATRYGTSFGILLLELAGQGAAAHAFETAAARLLAGTRNTDVAGRLGGRRAGVLLIHQAAEGVERAAARIVDELNAGASWRPRVLSYPRDSAEVSRLISAGWDEPADASRTA